jgi:hypothetical protein
MIIPVPIHSCEELASLRKWSARRGVRSITLALDADPTLLQSAEARINKNLHPCGCELAAVLLGVVLAISATIAIVSVALGQPLKFAHYCWMGGAVTAAILVGKSLGILRGELLLARAINEVLTNCNYANSADKEGCA